SGPYTPSQKNRTSSPFWDCKGATFIPNTKPPTQKNTGHIRQPLNINKKKIGIRVKKLPSLTMERLDPYLYHSIITANEKIWTEHPHILPLTPILNQMLTNDQ